MLAPPVQYQIDSSAPAQARPHRYPFEHLDLGWPVLDRVAVHRGGTRPGSASFEYQASLAQRYPQQVRQLGVRLRITRDYELRHDASVCQPEERESRRLGRPGTVHPHAAVPGLPAALLADDFDGVLIHGRLAFERADDQPRLREGDALLERVLVRGDRDFEGLDRAGAGDLGVRRAARAALAGAVAFAAAAAFVGGRLPSARRHPVGRRVVDEIDQRFIEIGLGVGDPYGSLCGGDGVRLRALATSVHGRSGSSTAPVSLRPQPVPTAPQAPRARLFRVRTPAVPRRGAAPCSGTAPRQCQDAACPGPDTLPRSMSWHSTSWPPLLAEGAQPDGAHVTSGQGLQAAPDGLALAERPA